MENQMLSDGIYRLRAPEPEDLDVLFGMENDTTLWLSSGNVVPYSRYQIKKYIYQSQHDFYTDRQIRFMIVSEAEDEVLGSIDLTDIDPYNGRAEIGIALLPAQRGKGIATAALNIMMQYAENVLRLQQVFCLVPADNAPSVKLFNNSGFTTSGTLKKWLVDGEKHTDVIVLQKFF